MKTIKFAGQLTLVVILCAILNACAEPVSYDLILRGGTIYDGSGGQPYIGDVAFEGDLIAALGDLGKASAVSVLATWLTR